MESEQRCHLTPMQFVDKRLKRVIFPLVVLSMIWFPLYYGLKLSIDPITIDFKSITLKILNVGGWFVEAILIMYCVFALFVYIDKKYGRTKSIITLCICTIMAYIFCDKCIDYYTPYSIPIFSAGIIASLYKDSNFKGIFNYSLVFLFFGMIFSMSYCIIVQKSLSLSAHSLFNYTIIGCLILFLTIFKPVLVFPAILGEASFDIYLIHKRIIISYFALNSVLIDLTQWLFLTAFITATFVYVRKSLWRRTEKFALMI